MKRLKASSARANSSFVSASVADVFSSFEDSSAGRTVASQIDSKTLNCLNLLNKKDSNSRSRALHDFVVNVLPSKTESEVMDILPHFVHYYAKGALLDPDWKCRAMYQNGLSEIHRIIGRRIEPSLPDVVCTWLVSMFDRSNREVSNSATKAFETVFTDTEKRKRIFVHFFSSLIGFISDLLQSTPVSLSTRFRSTDSAPTVDDTSFESGDRWERVVAAGILCMDYLVTIADSSMLTEIVSTDPCRFLLDPKCKTPVVILASVRLIIGLMRQEDAVATEWVSTFKRWDAVVVNLIDHLTSPECNQRTSDGWTLLDTISQATTVNVLKSRILAALESVDFRLIDVSMLKFVQSVLRRTTGDEAGKFSRRLTDAVFLHLKTCMSEDRRITTKYENVIHELINLAVMLVLRPDARAKLGTRVVELLSMCGDNFDMRRTFILEFARHVTETGSAEEVRSTIQDTVNAASVGAATAIVLESHGLIENVDISPADVANASEVKFMLEAVGGDRNLTLIASVCENSRLLIDWANDSARQSEFYTVLNTILCGLFAAARAQFDTLWERVVKELTFEQRVLIVTGSMADKADWVGYIEAGSTPPLTLPELTGSESTQRAFMDAIELRKPTMATSDDETIDNGLVCFGSAGFDRLITSMIESGIPIAEAVVLELVSSRRKTGSPAFFSDKLAKTAWTRLCREPSLDYSGVLTDFIINNPELVVECREIFVTDVILSTNTNPVDLSLMAKLFPSTENVENLLARMNGVRVPYQKWIPITSVFTRCNAFVELFARLAVRWPTDPAIVDVIATWRQLDVGSVVDIMWRIADLPSKHPTADAYPYLTLVNSIVSPRDRSIDDSPVEPLLTSLVSRGGLFELMLVQVLVANFHLSVSFSESLINALCMCRTPLASDAAAVNTINATLLELDGAYLVLDQPVPMVPRSTDRSMVAKRIAEENFAVITSTLIASKKVAVDTVYKSVSDLTFISSSSVADLMLTVGVPLEAAYSRYVLLGLAEADVDPRIVAVLASHGSVEWATECLNSHNQVTLGLKRIEQLDMDQIFNNRSLCVKLRFGNELAMDEYISLKLWTFILQKFVSVKADSFCFFIEFIEESVLSGGAAGLIGDVKTHYTDLGRTCLDIVQEADRSVGSAHSSLDAAALEALPLFLQGMAPGDIHDWVTGDRDINTSVAEKICVDHGISAYLIQNEISTNKYRNENLTTTFSMSSKLLICNYSSHGGEIQAELSVKFPDCWPIRLGTIEVSPVVGLSKAKNARLKIAIQRVFKLNGVQNAIQIWIENIEGFLKDVEECYICYSVTYHHGTKGTGTGTGTGGSIPNKQCKTCKYKFHSECLLKYFKTSGKTICCLCQNPF